MLLIVVDAIGNNVVIEMLADEVLILDKHTAEDDGKQLQVRHTSRLMTVLVSGRHVRVAFTSYTSLPIRV